MKSSLVIDHKKMHDIKSAAAVSGYSRDHVTSLARAKKIVAAQVGRQWFVDLDSLQQYASVTALEQQVRQKHLGEERRLQKELGKRIADRQAALKKNKAKHASHTQRSAAVLSALLFVATAGLGFFGDTLVSQTTNQVASSKVATPRDQVATLPGVAVTSDIPSQTSFSDGAVEVVTMAAQEEAIVLLPELAASSSVFSDEVSVAERADGVPVLVPAGRSPEEGVPYIVVPITEVNKL